jgi:hypothetical protein
MNSVQISDTTKIKAKIIKKKKKRAFLWLPWRRGKHGA